MTDGKWTCLHDGPRHEADLDLVEMVREHSSTEIAIYRCKACGGLYRWVHFEVNDWSGSGDYCDETTVWAALEPDEVDSVRRDPNYKPRSGREHRYDTGWRREG